MTAVGVFLFVSCLQGAVQGGGLLFQLRGLVAADRHRFRFLGSTSRDIAIGVDVACFLTIVAVNFCNQVVLSLCERFGTQARRAYVRIVESRTLTLPTA